MDLYRSVACLNRKYRGRNQEDAPELFRYFVDGLIEGELDMMKLKGLLSQEKTVFKKIESPTERILGHYNVSRVTCLHCDYISWAFHMSRDLALDIRPPQRREAEHLAKEKKQAEILLKNSDEKLAAITNGNHFLLDDNMRNKKEDPIPYFDEEKDKIFVPVNHGKGMDQEEPLELQDLLSRHFKRELLNNVENYYTCYKCNKTRGEPKRGEVRFITKTSFLYNLGPVFVITLKRFEKSTGKSWFGASGGFSKIDSHVRFPKLLDLAPYVMKKNNVKESHVYSIYAIVVHSGGMGGGHYVAYIKHIIQGKARWFYASDSHVSEVSESEALRAQAYILFYRKESN